MILCLDVGNSHLYAGVISDGDIVLRFRSTSAQRTSDEIGVFLRAALRENGIETEAIKQIAICSVVPHLDYSLRSACNKYFSGEPFILQAGVKTGLQIKYRNPLEVGADRIANAIAGAKLLPNKNLIIVDFGTATTFCAISADKEYLGGTILPGMRLGMDALTQKTAKLPPVEIVKAEQCIGRSTVESIQSGLYYGALGSLREIITTIEEQCFAGQTVAKISTGGFAHLFEGQDIFDMNIPDLVLQGLYAALEMNSL